LARDGKRLRAELIELSYRIAGGKGDAPLDLIEFVELLHAGSLVIDDIEDGSTMRRGQLTLHEAVGTPLAINTGNWMYFSALEKLQDLPLPPEQLMSVLSESISTIRRGHEGQALDLAAKVAEMDRRTIYPTVRAITRLKTGGVTALAAKLGAALAGADRNRQRAFHAFGMQLGIGLQMQNDLVELKSGTQFGGRSDDLRNARVTWPWAWVSRLRSEREFVELQCLLLESSEENFQGVATKLLDSISTVADKSVRRKMNGAMVCLAGAVDPRSAEALKKLAERIEAYHV
jgi:geranylgeranyl pyrophosphate synthase